MLHSLPSSRRLPLAHRLWVSPAGMETYRGCAMCMAAQSPTYNLSERLHPRSKQQPLFSGLTRLPAVGLVSTMRHSTWACTLPQQRLGSSMALLPSASVARGAAGRSFRWQTMGYLRQWRGLKLALRRSTNAYHGHLSREMPLSYLYPAPPKVSGPQPVQQPKHRGRHSTLSKPR